MIPCVPVGNIDENQWWCCGARALEHATLDIEGSDGSKMVVASRLAEQTCVQKVPFNSHSDSPEGEEEYGGLMSSISARINTRRLLNNPETSDSSIPGSRFWRTAMLND